MGTKIRYFARTHIILQEKRHFEPIKKTYYSLNKVHFGQRKAPTHASSPISPKTGNVRFKQVILFDGAKNVKPHSNRNTKPLPQYREKHVTQIWENKQHELGEIKIHELGEITPF